MEPKQIRVTLTGSYATGKSTLFNRITRQEFQLNCRQTIHSGFHNLKIPTFCGSLNLSFFEPAGQEKFYSIPNALYRDVSIVLFVYSIDSKISFSSLEKIIRSALDVKSDLVGYIVANKIDLEELRQVQSSEGEELAQKFGFEFFEVGAFEDHPSIESIFYGTGGILERYCEGLENPLVLEVIEQFGNSEEKGRRDDYKKDNCQII